MSKILIADDEIKIRETIADYMRAKGYETVLARDGVEAVEKALSNPPDIILLDIMMPRKNGIEACREIREFTDAPVIFLTALGEERDFLLGYKSGADDYIVKPFPLPVLCEKCNTMLRRFSGADAENKLTAGSITLDLHAHRVFVADKETPLTGKDFELLKYLILNRGKVMSRSLILDKIWGYDYEGDSRVVDTHIKRIRKALGKNGDCIRTVVNAGYSFEEERM